MRRVQQLRPLSNDHHRALVLAKRAKQANDDESIAQAWAQLIKYYPCLIMHFEVEEQNLVALKQHGHGDLYDMMVADHIAIRAMFEAEDRASAEALRILGERLAEHVRFEEKQLFAAVQACFDEAQLAQIETATQA